MLSLRSIWREALARFGQARALCTPDPFDFAQGRLFGTEVPQDDAWERTAALTILVAPASCRLS